VPTAEAFERCMSARWQRLLAVNSLEMLVRDDGVAALEVFQRMADTDIRTQRLQRRDGN
jgi:hypothetical protein